MSTISKNKFNVASLPLLLMCGVLISTLAGCFDSTEPETPEVVSSVNSEDEVQNIVSSEELILTLTRRLKPLNRAAMNLQIPSGEAKELFASQAMITDIGSVSESVATNDYLTVQRHAIDPTGELSQLGFWNEFLSTVSYFETAKFYFVDGVLEADRKTFQSNMGFAAHVRLSDQSIGYVRAKMHVTWSMSGTADEMQISAWETKQFECSVSGQPMFKDVTRDSVSDSLLADELASSKQEEITRKLALGEPVDRPTGDKYPFFFPEVTLEHPGVSVVDLNDDGFDDFFLARQHQPSLFFMNNGDGTFAEVGAGIGLNLEGGCTCSLFADYDNDGDQDLFAGFARQRAVYLENSDGKFTDQTRAKINWDLPFMVSSISAADYNGDGLLDVYFSTYSPIEGTHGIDVSNSIWPKMFLDLHERTQYLERRARGHQYIDMTGPPNLLLENIGSGFVASDFNHSVATWRKSFQASWSDYDTDGDPDLYVCNDFAPDDLFRNDGDQGFKRVNDEVGLQQLGFGMGATWGDYNNDGNMDLYVSNMYSKAGKRITGQIEGLDPKFAEIATGNYLFELQNGKFKLVSGADGPQKAVATAGWSWGGQFADIDNDGALDLFVAAGYYSAPQEIAEDVDL